MSPVLDRYQRLLQGDKKEISDLYNVLLPKLKSWIIANNGQAGDARDVIHEGLTSLLIAGHKKPTKAPNNIEAFVFTVCKYKWIDTLKQRKTIDRVTFESDIRDIEEGSAQDKYIEMESDAIKHKVLERAFAKLSDLCQQLLNLVKEGMKAKEIAQHLSMKGQSTVNRRKFACMESWRKYMKEDQDYVLISNDRL